MYGMANTLLQTAFKTKTKKSKKVRNSGLQELTVPGPSATSIEAAHEKRNKRHRTLR
jgi:hypothetical protein